MKFHAPITAAILLLVLAIANLPNHCNAKTTQNLKGSNNDKIEYMTSRKLKSAKAKKKSKKSKKPKVKAPKQSKYSAQRAVTMWWVLFNKPSECKTNPTMPIKCGVPDVMQNANNGENLPQISIMHASGGISDTNGFLRLNAALYKTSSCDLDLGKHDIGNGHYLYGGPPALYDAEGGASRGYCPAAGEDTEVHIVLRDHGPETSDKLWQITRFTDPSCSQNGGPNVCADNGAIAFPPMSENGMMTKDIGNFPMFPPGCSQDGSCTKAQEAVQLTAGMGNQVTLIRTGDALQAVAEVTLPKV